jgi:hypothetical protein
MLTRMPMLGILGVPLAQTSSCSTAATTTISGIIVAIQETCSFLLSTQSVAQLLAAYISGFNATAGAATTVAVGIATTVENDVCAALMPKTSLPGAAPLVVGSVLTVTVHGVSVTGKMV